MEYRTIPVRVSNGYEVQIGAGLMDECGAAVKRALGACRVVVITDSNVEKLYLARVMHSFHAAGTDVCSYAFPAGEGSKRMETLADILEFLALSKLTRGDAVVALGGGVTGDLTGFAAGCYLRGVRYVQMPTTLLAAVDSSVGGKTAVDLKEGKNLAGLFYQPSLVICDTDSFATLPGEEFANGAAEAIKTGILGDEPLFRLFESGGAREHIDEIVARCVAFKAHIVEKDERENGLRKTLNLGHTVGHAIETCSGYALAHGHAVAVGLAIIARAAEARGEAEKPTADRIEQNLLRNGLPVSTPYSPEELARAAFADKKREGGSITLVLPRRIGACSLKTVPMEELASVIRMGMEGGA